MGIEDSFAPVGPVPLSKVALSETHGENSPYFAGWRAYDDDPYHELDNPTGVIQTGFAENQDYLAKYLEASIWGKGGVPVFRENALFRDYHGLQSFSKSMASFMEQIRCGRAEFNPERVVTTAGATAANEHLTFILVDRGDALLVCTPYYPRFDRDLRWRTGVKIVPIHCRHETQGQRRAHHLPIEPSTVDHRSFDPGVGDDREFRN